METPSPTDPAIVAAERAGFDLSLVETNLALPVSERWRQHDMALDLMLKFEAARIERDARLSRPAPSSH